MVVIVRKQFQLIIETENDAFQPDVGPELAAILRNIASRLTQGLEPGSHIIFDTNGNACGTFRITR